MDSHVSAAAVAHPSSALSRSGACGKAGRCGKSMSDHPSLESSGLLATSCSMPKGCTWRPISVQVLNHYLRLADIALGRKGPLRDTLPSFKA